MARNIKDAWRAQVIHRSSGLTNQTIVLMLELHQRMRHDGTVSVPRIQLADALGVDPSRIRERLREAVDKQHLDRVVRGRPGTTAVYRAVLKKGAARRPSEERSAAPQEGGGILTHVEERPAAPPPSVAHGAPVQPANKKHPPKLNSAPHQNGHKSAATTADRDRCTTCGTRDALDNRGECHNCALTRTA